MSDDSVRARVILADDHAIVRQGLRAVLTDFGIEITDEAIDVTGLVRACQKHDPDIAIMDLHMRGEASGEHGVRQVLNAAPGVAVLVYSMRESLSSITKAYQAGASGYVTKSADPERVTEAIERIRTGRRYYMPGMAEQILDFEHHEHGEKDPRNVLSEVELKIFERQAAGWTNEAIAEQIGITAKSVANRSHEIRRKLGIRLTAFEWVARKFSLLELNL